ncbi:MAG: PP0621 family protein [Candidatus Binatia bacterium]
MLIRLVLFLGIICALILVLRAFFASRRQRSKQFNHAARRDAEDMVLDPQCGAYLPKGEAILQEGRYFCSRECANLYLSR